MKDIFFGEIQSKRNQLPSVSLHDLTQLTERVSPEFFTGQINRLLQVVGGELVISDGTSEPEFEKLLGNLLESSIGLIELESQSHINSNVRATLSCSIFLPQGVIRVQPHWCAYKESRADELVSSLLVPLHLNAMIDKTSIRWSHDEFYPLLEDGLYREELFQIFRLAKYPFKSDLEKDDRLERYIMNLDWADEVSAKGLKGEEAETAYYEDKRSTG